MKKETKEQIFCRKETEEQIICLLSLIERPLDNSSFLIK